MAAPDLLASNVMDISASLLNDSGKQIYTYVAQLPYLTIACKELQEEFELHNIPVTQNVSAVINIPLTSPATVAITYNAIGTPRLPDDMIEPAELWERQAGIDPFIPMTRMDYLPHNAESIVTNQIIYWAWQGLSIVLMPTNQPNDIKIDYIKYLFPPASSINQNSSIGVINAETFLEYRTAALCAEFIERNITSAQSLNAYAILAKDRVEGIGAKGKQAINTRRRPFRAAYKKRGWMT